jgi:hypothetical protein
MGKPLRSAAIDHMVTSIRDVAVTLVAEQGYSYAEMVTASVIAIPALIALGDTPEAVEAATLKARALMASDAFSNAVDMWVHAYEEMVPEIADALEEEHLIHVAQRCAAKDFDA